ncbi:rhodanese-like domain-containing protein [Chloroflexota bacterium]
MKLWPSVVTITILLVLLIALPLLSACAAEEEVVTEEEVEFEIVQDAVAEYLPNKAGNMKAEDLHMRIAEDDAPYIVSLRSAEDYAKGHIPGAVNKKFGELTTLPEDEEILVYCYTGQSGSFGAAVLGILGYDVQNLRHGMSSWSDDPAVYVSRFDASVHQGDYDVETTANSGGNYDYPELDNTASSDEDDIVAAAAAAVSPKYITAADMKMKIAEDEDMTIVSVRSAEQYAAGHVPGAINIGLAALADNLNKIDPDLPVYVYCYTGHSAAQATALLQMLGYDAYSLKFGMCSWSSDPAINAGSCFDASTVGGYETEK